MSESQIGSLTLGMELSLIAVVYAVVVLTVLALTIKIITYYIRPKPQQVVSVVTPKEELVSEDDKLIALATIAVHKYLSEKSVATFGRITTIQGLNPWVSSWRIECSTTPDYIYMRKVRSS